MNSLLIVAILVGLIAAKSKDVEKPKTAEIKTETQKRLCGGIECGNGICDETSGKCVCSPGWLGAKCDACGGKVALTSSSGWIADAVGNYSVNSKCTWVIQASSAHQRIRLHLKSFATECGWDHLYVFDGDSVFADLKAVYSGLVRRDRYQIQGVPEVVVGNVALLHFYSDVAYNMTGFNVTFSVDDCPSVRHDLTCSGHGTCDASDGRCQCDDDFGGEACEAVACRNGCKDEDGYKRGHCDDKQCVCDAGWAGDSCSKPEAEGYWSVLKPDSVINEPHNIPRTSHAAMIDAWGRMWVVGGETFERSKRTSRHMVAFFDVASPAWTEVKAVSDKGPSARYGHSAVIHDQKIYMYGGTMRSGHTSKELWSFDIDRRIWAREETNPGQCLASLCGPVHSVGHTANVVSNRMIVIFGHSPKYGYLDMVQEYHFGSREWSIISDTTGYPVRGGFGHTSVYDKISKKIYVYGGYVSTQTSSAQVTNDIYSFDPLDKVWQRLTPSDSFRFLHSAVAANGLMLVFGGNTHNDTNFSHGAKCFSSDFIVYDIACDRWYNAQDSVPKLRSVDLARYGHSAVNFNGTMIIHGGFHGRLKNDVIAYTPGNCGLFKQRKACLESRVGAKCVWDAKKDVCVRLSSETMSEGHDSCLITTKPIVELHSASWNASTNFCKSLKSCVSCVSTTSQCVWCENECKFQQCSEDRTRISIDNEKSEVYIKNVRGGRNNYVENATKVIEIASEGGGYASVPTKFTTAVPKGVTSLPQCLKASASVNSKAEVCSGLHTCHACSVHGDCRWEMQKTSKCQGIVASSKSSDSTITSSRKKASSSRAGGDNKGATHESSFSDVDRGELIRTQLISFLSNCDL